MSDWSNIARVLVRLDPDQATAVAAVRARAAHVQMPAGAGSGKTAVVVASIGALLSDGVEPEKLIATTFTVRAGIEMRQRVERIVGRSLAGRVRIVTFHGLARRACAAAEIPVLSDPSRNMDSDKRAEGLPSPNQLWRQILGFREIPALNGRKGLDIDLASKFLTPGDYGLAADLIRGRGISIRDKNAREEARKVRLPQFWKAWDWFEEAKASLEAYDFADSLQAYHDGLKSGAIADAGDVVFVDEVQDNNPLQTEIAALLARNGRLVAVGDSRQAIYSWRGASTRFFFEFGERFTAVSCPLRRNYRSGRKIVALGNLIAEGKAWAMGEPSIAARDFDGSLTIDGGHADPIEEGDAVARMIRQEIDAGARPDDFAVLARTNAVLGAFEAGCIRHRVPCAVVGGKGFFTHRDVLDALAYAVLIRHDSFHHLERIIGRPKRYLGAAFIEELRQVWSPGQDLVKAIRTVASSGRVRGRANELADDIERLRRAGWPSARDMREEHVGNEGRGLRQIQAGLAGEAIEADVDEQAALRGLGMIPGIILPPPSEVDENRDPGNDPRALVWALVRIAATFGSAQELVHFAKECVAGVAAVEEGAKRGEMGTEGRVTLSTVFKAKGLEYPTVIVSASANVFPHARSVQAGEERLDEEERLFYVAVTRARDRLVCTWAERTLRGKAAGPSMFLDYVRKIDGQAERPPGHELDAEEINPEVADAD